jgi:penicillin-binding protein 2
VIATPLQILISAATIANDGVMMRPTIVREIVDGEGNVVPVVFDTDGNYLPNLTVDEDGNVVGAVPEGVEPVIMSPFFPDVKRDLTQDAVIMGYENPEGIGACKETGELKTVQPWVFETLQAGMRRAVTNGTLSSDGAYFYTVQVPAAGKTGTAEYCDAVALENNRCIYGNWPTHAWTVAYAPYDDPEIVVIAFLYNGGEGASVAGPVVAKILNAYFGLKEIDAGLGIP